MRKKLGIMLVLFALAVGACAPVERAISSLVPPPPAPSEALDELEIVEAIEFRDLVGLRADEPWVREVAANPIATTNYGVPLMPFEEAELARRAANAHEIAPIVEAYGAEHADEYGGLYIDSAADGVVVVTFTANVEEHSAALRKLLAPDAQLEVREAIFSSEELRDLQERIAMDETLQEEGIFVLTTGADEAAGVVTVELSTERPDGEAFMFARYGPAVRATVLDPTGAYLKPRGVISGRVIDEAGRGIAASLAPEPLFAKDLPLDAIGYGTNPDGTFLFADQLVGRWRITATAEGYEPGSGEVDVASGRVSRVEIVLRPSP